MCTYRYIHTYSFATIKRFQDRFSFLALYMADLQRVRAVEVTVDRTGRKKSDTESDRRRLFVRITSVEMEFSYRNKEYKFLCVRLLDSILKIFHGKFSREFRALYIMKLINYNERSKLTILD